MSQEIEVLASELRLFACDVPGLAKEVNYFLQRANWELKEHGHDSFVSSIVFSTKNVSANGEVLEAQRGGMVKTSTGEFVPNAYIKKCKGRGVHYQYSVGKVKLYVNSLAIPYCIKPQL